MGVIYQFENPLHPAMFLRRLNRFSAEVILDGERVLAHVPHTGRLPELLIPGKRCFLAPTLRSKRRKTRWTLTLVELGGDEGLPVSPIGREDETPHADTLKPNLGCIDTGVPNKLVRMMAEESAIPGLKGWTYEGSEVRFADSRIDFLISKGTRRMLLEVKSVTWVVNRCALFPDAPTLRGIKHLENLIYARGKRIECAMVFVVQREDADQLRIADFIHPGYLEKAREAREGGIRFLAINCKVSKNAVEVIRRIPVHIKSSPTKIISLARIISRMGY